MRLCFCIYVWRKVRIGTIPELSLRKVGILLCPPIPELYRTILELRKGYISGCHRILYVRKVRIGLDKVGINGQCKVRIIEQSKNNRGMSTNIYRNRNANGYGKKKNISKIKIAVEIDQENNNKDFWTILFAAKDSGGLILYLY